MWERVIIIYLINNMDKIYIAIYQQGINDSLQIVIEDEHGNGYRLLGPKLNGDGRLIDRRALNERDATEIRQALDTAHPQKYQDKKVK